MTTYTGTPKATPRLRALLVACGTALALGAIAGLGAWQIGLHGHGNARVAAPPQHLETSAEKSNAPTSSVSAASNVAAAALSTEPTTMILVSSPEAAREAERDIAALNAVAAQNGPPPVGFAVRQVNSREEAQAVRYAIALQNGANAMVGLPELQVDDRTGFSIAPAAPGAAVAAVAPLTVYLVPSESQRTLVAAYLQRNGLHAVAYAVSSPDEAAEFNLPGMTLASAAQWSAVEAALQQQRVQADQQAITRAMTGQ
jgi:hypothetical protein